MSPMQAVVHGTLHADGTLMLDENPGLPPGRVEVLLHVMARPGGRPTVKELANRFRREAESRPGREKREVDDELAAMRAEWDESDIGIRKSSRRTDESNPSWPGG